MPQKQSLQNTLFLPDMHISVLSLHDINCEEKYMKAIDMEVFHVIRICNIIICNIRSGPVYDICEKLI